MLKNLDMNTYAMVEMIYFNCLYNFSYREKLQGINFGSLLLPARTLAGLNDFGFRLKFWWENGLFIPFDKKKSAAAMCKPQTLCCSTVSFIRDSVCCASSTRNSIGRRIICSAVHNHCAKPESEAGNSFSNPWLCSVNRSPIFFHLQKRSV